MTIYLSLLVCIIGLLMYALCTNGKLIDIGRMSFFAGLLTFLLRVAADSFSLLKV